MAEPPKKPIVDAMRTPKWSYTEGVVEGEKEERTDMTSVISTVTIITPSDQDNAVSGVAGGEPPPPPRTWLQFCRQVISRGAGLYP